MKIRLYFLNNQCRTLDIFKGFTNVFLPLYIQNKQTEFSHPERISKLVTPDSLVQWFLKQTTGIYVWIITHSKPQFSQALTTVFVTLINVLHFTVTGFRSITFLDKMFWYTICLIYIFSSLADNNRTFTLTQQHSNSYTGSVIE